MIESLFQDSNWTRQDLRILDSQILLSSKANNNESNAFSSFEIDESTIDDRNGGGKIKESKKLKYRVFVNTDFEFEYSLNVLGDIRALHHALPDDALVAAFSYSRLWSPLIKLSEILRIKARQPHCYIPRAMMNQFMELGGFSKVQLKSGILLPFYLPFLSNFVNRWFSPLPFFRRLCLLDLAIYAKERNMVSEPSVSIIIAARNEEGNIEHLLKRMPQLSNKQEVVFVEGNSKDNTWNQIKYQTENIKYSFDIRLLKQQGQGKADAVHLGISEASHELIMLLDADLSVPPESLVEFYETMRRPRVDFCNGTRFVYPQQIGAMRKLNFVGNLFFASLMTFLVGQKLSDSLCGTKVFWKKDYREMYFNIQDESIHDPFGDFEFLVGASRRHLRIANVPVNYKSRIYGETNISRFVDGSKLLKYCLAIALQMSFFRSNRN